MLRQSSNHRSLGLANDYQQVQHPQLTQGPVRFITANDGSRECLALLVTDNFMAALNDIYEKKDHLDTISGPLLHAGMDIEGIEASLRSCKEALDKHTNPSLIEEDQRFMEEQEPKLAKLRQLKQKLERDFEELERGISGARAHADWALETAMESGRLLRPKKPYRRPVVSDIVDAYRSSTRQGSASSADRSRASPGSEGKRQCEADDDVSAYGYELRRRQSEFDNREYTYHKQLAEYQRGLKDGTYEFSRTEFDGRMLAYGRDITRELIEAEENYDRAKARREALGVRSSCDRSSLHSRGYEESMSKDDFAAYVSSLDKTSIEAWRANVTTCETPEESREIIMDDFDAGLVHISDSASAADDGQYTRMINRWQQIRGVCEGFNQSRTNDIWSQGVGDSDRRHSS